MIESIKGFLSKVSPHFFWMEQPSLGAGLIVSIMDSQKTGELAMEMDTKSLP